MKTNALPLSRDQKHVLPTFSLDAPIKGFEI